MPGRRVKILGAARRWCLESEKILVPKRKRTDIYNKHVACTLSPTCESLGEGLCARWWESLTVLLRKGTRPKKYIFFLSIF